MSRTDRAERVHYAPPQLRWILRDFKDAPIPFWCHSETDCFVTGGWFELRNPRASVNKDNVFSSYEAACHERARRLQVEAHRLQRKIDRLEQRASAVLASEPPTIGDPPEHFR